MPCVTAGQASVRWRHRADGVRNVRGLKAAFIGQYIDDSVVARRQQSGPIGRHFAPELLLWPLANESSLGAVALDEAFVFQHVESLADGRACDAALGCQLVHGRSLSADRPVTRFDASPK